MTRLSRAALLLLLAGPALPALAEEPAGTEARMAACAAGLDVDAITARSEAFAAAHDYQQKLDAFCAAGDNEGAYAFTTDLEKAYYASDPEAAKLNACLKDILGGDIGATPDDVCEP